MYNKEDTSIEWDNGLSFVCSQAYFTEAYMPHLAPIS